MTSLTRADWEQRANDLKIEGRAFVHGEFRPALSGQTTISVLIVLLLAFTLMACKKEEIAATAPSEQTASATAVEQEQAPAEEKVAGEEKAPAEEKAEEEKAPAVSAEQK
jgi:4-guanidinobutyraldehyde dehydrogenase/NAD-dependent aldehyde dehydrogenase